LNKVNLVVATTNQGKLKEIKAALEGLPVRILSLKELNLNVDYREKGKTFGQNARGKSLFYSQLTSYLTLTEDSGLEVKALGKAPGVFSARFAGPEADDEKNIAKVLAQLRKVPPAERQARFICYLCLAQKGKIIKCVRGEVRGWITKEKRGGHGFGYDPIFFYRPFGCTFGEIPASKKNLVSHRGRALRQMRQFLEAFLGAAAKKKAAP